MLPDSDQFTAHSPVARPRVSNGSWLFPTGVDGRKAVARRFRDLIVAHTAELGHEPSEAEASIIRRASALEVQLEHLEGGWMNRAPPDAASLAAYSRLSNTLRRHLAAVGLGRATPSARRAPPTLSPYLASSRGLAK